MPDFTIPAVEGELYRVEMSAAHFLSYQRWLHLHGLRLGGIPWTEPVSYIVTPILALDDPFQPDEPHSRT
jgi:hypothetical protein